MKGRVWLGAAALVAGLAFASSECDGTEVAGMCIAKGLNFSPDLHGERRRRAAAQVLGLDTSQLENIGIAKDLGLLINRQRRDARDAGPGILFLNDLRQKRDAPMLLMPDLRARRDAPMLFIKDARQKRSAGPGLSWTNQAQKREAPVAALAIGAPLGREKRDAPSLETAPLMYLQKRAAAPAVAGLSIGVPMGRQKREAVPKTAGFDLLPVQLQKRDAPTLFIEPPMERRKRAAVPVLHIGAPLEARRRKRSPVVLNTTPYHLMRKRDAGRVPGFVTKRLFDKRDAGPVALSLERLVQKRSAQPLGLSLERLVQKRSAGPLSLNIERLVQKRDTKPLSLSIERLVQKRSIVA